MGLGSDSSHRAERIRSIQESNQRSRWIIILSKGNLKCASFEIPQRISLVRNLPADRSLSENLLCESLWPLRLCGEAHLLRNQRRDAEHAEVRRGIFRKTPVRKELLKLKPPTTGVLEVCASSVR